MATTQVELLTQNKNRAKRDRSSASFTLAIEIPGSQTLGNGAHVVGKLEGNIAITRIALLVRDGFDGTTPTVALDDSDALAWFPATDISAPVVEESAETAHAAVQPAPIYKSGPTEFTATIAGSSTKGELAFIIDYVQLDTVVGKHTI